MRSPLTAVGDVLRKTVTEWKVAEIARRLGLPFVSAIALPDFLRSEYIWGTFMEDVVDDPILT